MKTAQGFTARLNTFDELRVETPLLRSPPNWRALTSPALIVSPSAQEGVDFTALLSQRIPPGPAYIELIEEIWNRGFETFLVGGTVRDVIAGAHTNDVDLVTTMPLVRAVPLLKSMYRREPSIHHLNGFVRLGGTPASGDPFIDLKSFVTFDPGTENAIFGSNFLEDIRHRDFACNSLYYEPVNQALIDPTGHGISDSHSRTLTLVCDHNIRTPAQRARIAIRFFKFRCRGFGYDSHTEELIRAHYLPVLYVFERTSLIHYVRTQLLSKLPRESHAEALVLLELTMKEFGAEQEWVELLEPIRNSILTGAH